MKAVARDGVKSRRSISCTTFLIKGWRDGLPLFGFRTNLGAYTALQALLGKCSLRCATSCIPAVVRKWDERCIFPGYPRQIATAIFLGSPKICPRSPTSSLRAPMPYTLLPSHFERSTLNHSYGYASSADRPNCLASFTLNSESFMHIRARVWPSHSATRGVAVSSLDHLRGILRSTTP